MPADLEKLKAEWREQWERELREALLDVEPIEAAAKMWALTLVRRGLERPVPPPELAGAREGIKAALARANKTLKVSDAQD